MPEYLTEEDFRKDCGYLLDSIWYPRVTKIVSIKSKPALLKYYGESESYEAAKRSTNASAEEGTKIHEAAEAILLGNSPLVDQSIAPALNAFIQLIEKKNITTREDLVEKRILNKKHRYAGTTDALIFYKGKFGVLDIKTSGSIYRDYNLQTAAYIEALKEDYPELQTRWILRVDQRQTCARCGAKKRVKGGRETVRKRGNFLCSRHLGHDWLPLTGEAEIKEFPDWQHDFEAFLGAKKLWEWEHERWLKKIGYLPHPKEKTEGNLKTLPFG